MKSLKGKLIVIILALVIFVSVSSAGIVLIRSLKTTDAVVNHLAEDNLVSSNNMLKVYLKEQFGSFSLSDDNKLLDENGEVIDDKYEYIDRFSESMNVVATIFAKNGDEFTRVITTIKDKSGNRVVGTHLDKSSEVYKKVQSGDSYIGDAIILGKNYSTSYEPILDGNHNVIGIYFVGMLIEDVNEIVDIGNADIARTATIIAVVALIFSFIIVYIISNSISKPIKKVTAAAKSIADGNFNVELSIKSKDEVGQLAKAFKQTIDRLVNYQSYRHFKTDW